MTGFLEDLRRLGLTLLLIEHDMKVVMGLATGSRRWITARRSPRARPRGPRDPRVIEAYLGSGAAEASNTTSQARQQQRSLTTVQRA